MTGWTEENQSGKEKSHRRRSLRSSLLVLGLVAAFLSRSQSASAQGGAYPMNYSNYPPRAQDDYVMTMEGMPMPINVISNDTGTMAPLDPTTVEIVDEPLHGVVSVDLSSGCVLYVPNPDFYGIDDFTYVVSDTNGLVSNVATVSVLVMEDIPVIQTFTAAPVGDGSLVLSGQVLDLNPGGIIVTFGGLASGTVATQDDGSFRYTVSVPSGTSGVVTAQAFNEYGNDSSVVNAYVFNR